MGSLKPLPAIRKGLQGDRFGGRSVKPGDAVEVSLKVSESVLHQDLRVPVLVLRGAKPGPTLYVTSAIHGDEVLGAAILRRLLDGLERRLDSGTLIAVPVANRFGFDSGDRYLPDRRDLNRHFPGDKAGNMASRIADTLFRKVVLPSNAGIDLHTAASGHSNLCHIRGDASQPRVRDLMRAFGCPVMVHGDGPRGSLRRAATEAGVPSVLYEAGEPGRFQRHAVEIGHQGLVRLLGHLGMARSRSPGPGLQILVRKSFWVRSDHGGIIDLSVDPGDLVRAGQLLATVFDPYGTHVDAVESPDAGVVLGVATNPLAHPGSALVHVGRLEKTLSKARAYVAAGGDLGHVGWKARTARRGAKMDDEAE